MILFELLSSSIYIFEDLKTSNFKQHYFEIRLFSDLIEKNVCWNCYRSFGIDWVYALTLYVYISTFSEQIFCFIVKVINKAVCPWTARTN